MGLLDIFKPKQEPVEETKETEASPEPVTPESQENEASGEVAPEEKTEEEKKEEVPGGAM